uniref:SHSP domain-containing protein n=1 Tax=Takifugu rubripes TaxID=31033 RepID=A0A674PG84_TAKRU
MATVTSSSRRSSSSYRSSARYSTSSTYHSEGSLAGSRDSLDPLFEPFSTDRPSGAVAGRQSSAGGAVRCLGDSYYMSADVGQFEPHDVVVMAFNHHVVLDDGSVSDTFTHKSLFPEDMDPLSLCGTLHADGTLVVSVRRASASGGQEALAGPTYRSEAYL